MTLCTSDTAFVIAACNMLGRCGAIFEVDQLFFIFWNSYGFWGVSSNLIRVTNYHWSNVRRLVLSIFIVVAGVYIIP